MSSSLKTTSAALVLAAHRSQAQLTTSARSADHISVSQSIDIVPAMVQVWLKWSFPHVIVERALQLERAGLPCSMDSTDSPCCANWSLTSPASHYVSINGRIALIKSHTKALESDKRRMFLFCNSRWQCYSSHHRTQRVCYSLLLRLLRTIDAEWDPAAVRGDLVGSLPSASQ